MRSRQALHPKGVSFEGSAVVHDAGSGLADVRDVGVEARLSRGVGLPHPLPDFNGVAVRFRNAHGPDRHQDLLFVAAGNRPGFRHLILPMPYLASSGYSTVLPYRTPAGQRLVFRCDPLRVESLTDAAAALPLRVEILVASLIGPWTSAATITLTSVLASSARSRFDPWNTSSQLLPSGVLNRLRAPAYVGSRAATRADDERGPLRRALAAVRAAVLDDDERTGRHGRSRSALGSARTGPLLSRRDG